MAARLTGGSGLKQDKFWRDALLRAVKRKMEGGTGTYLECIASKVVALALDGDMVAVKEIGDRLDGRAASGILDDMPENGRLVLVWETTSASSTEPSLVISESPSLMPPDLSSSPSTIEHSDIPSALPTVEPAKP